ncbi:L-ribulose-5-phosphate 4-epimerase [Neobacillus sp.]|uniref:L-ribulose-5-phosphate 4-epimerase n=1 Tax=Neobacillus sp. TaxID=2675273 RepID=UPI00289DAD84|nr:L-ribulose-5-phosphate 4-epimerase [Neobacillus sp.]
MLLYELRKRVWKDNIALPANGLVLWTSGNVSARDPESNLVVIKPSGVHFEDLTPENLTIVDLDGNVVEGDLAPSVDTESHLYVYRHRSDIHGITHTHSPYATCFAIRGKSLPIYTTTSAAVFGGEIPISDLAAVGEKAIGAEIVKKIGDNSALLLKSHGVFTVGKSSTASLKAAVILEETAQSVHYALSLGNDIQPLAEDYIKEVYDFYQNNYGQKK